MPVRPWKLAETNYAFVKEHRFEVAVLPLGATEPHNLHLPYGTDTFEGEIIGEEICAAAHERGARLCFCRRSLTAPRRISLPIRYR